MTGPKSVGAMQVLARALALVAVLAAALVPPGYMPARDSDGLLSMVICTGQGETTVSVDTAGNPLPLTPDDQVADPCPWWVTAQESILTPVVQLTIPVATTAAAPVCVSDLVAATAPCRTFAPRGPPILL